jgi:hypothetical protein
MSRRWFAISAHFASRQTEGRLCADLAIAASR